MTTPKPPLYLVALAPLVGLYTIAMPYLYWRIACWVWGVGQNANLATFFAACAQVGAASVFLVWRSEQ